MHALCPHVTNLHEEDGRGEDECHGPGGEHGLLGLAQRAEVLRLERVHDGVVPGQEKRGSLISECLDRDIQYTNVIHAPSPKQMLF